MALPQSSEPNRIVHEDQTQSNHDCELPSPPTATGGGVPLATPLPIPLQRPLPAQLGRYRIVRLLGSGGMASVYLAHDAELDRQVALKVPHCDPRLGSQLLERFTREARAAAILQHPNICQVYDVGRIDGVPFLTMAYIEGQPLAQRIEPGKPWPQQEAAQLIRTVALALADAHSRGVIHRDLKPSNIMMDRHGQPILMDFGLARRIGPPPPAGSPAEQQPLTEWGTVMGTPAYMPPEQVLGELDSLGPASDVYSLGVILFQLLTGQLPWKGTAVSILASIISQEPPSPLAFREDLDPALEAICLKTMARQPAQRYASMPELAEALASFRSPGVSPEKLPGETPITQIDPAIARTALDLLRTWGWSMGLRQLKFKVQGQRRRAWQSFFDWLAGEPSCTEGLGRCRAEPWFIALEGWRLAGQSLTALRQRDFRRAHQLLRRSRRHARQRISPPMSC